MSTNEIEQYIDGIVDEVKDIKLNDIYMEYYEGVRLTFMLKNEKGLSFADVKFNITDFTNKSDIDSLLHMFKILYKEGIKIYNIESEDL